uniref:Nitric oxide synthase 1 (neuronal) adaptor protein b n=1 Tax=Neolamprologus brichardi TaxID=32507 RepID=A0A3Q4MCR9_NEOBR
MPGVTKYNLVDDAQDLRIPMHNEEVFKHGVCFEAKYIGSLEVGRPGSRMEIVAAMRRIRYEFKLKNIKKKKVNIVVSTDFVKVILRKKRKVSLAQPHMIFPFTCFHTLNDIFVLSHSCQLCDFCLETEKRSQAMRIVRTVGQAFDVCHQLTLQQKDDEQEDEEGKAEELQAVPGDSHRQTQTHKSASAKPLPSLSRLPVLLLSHNTTHTTPPRPGLRLLSPILGASVLAHAAAGGSCSAEHQVHFLQKQLQQQEQQALAASAQVNVLQEQLSVEACARTEAQARVQRLLQQNTDLLQHISLLVKQIQELELKAAGQLTSMGSQDSLLEITFRAKPPGVPHEPPTPSSSTGLLAAESQLQIRETPSDGAPDESSLLREQVLGALELLRFRESGIGSEYESNTDESDDRDSWGQGEGAGADGGARLLNVLNAESLPDCLGDEMAV